MADELLNKSRKLLSKFEVLNDNEKKEGLLNDALSYLSNVIKGNFSDDKKRIAKNIILSHRRVLFEKINDVIDGPDFIDDGIIEGWHSLLTKFKEFGFGD